MKSLELLQKLPTLQHETKRLETLLKSLNRLDSLEEKIVFLKPSSPEAVRLHEKYRRSIHSPMEEFILLSLIAIGQEFVLPDDAKTFETLIGTLLKVENLYAPMGGLIGYHFEFLKQLVERETFCKVEGKGIEKPPGVDLESTPSLLKQVVESGISSLNQAAEIYPIGGAADRLDLHDEATGEPLPAAELNFLGFNLLEWLIRDLQAREYLYYKYKGKRTSIPLILMTSSEKNNHDRVRTILERHNWFGKKKEDFFLIKQPSVPQIGEEGNWIVSSPGHLSLKPGGHGVIWRLAELSGAFEWLKKKRKKYLVARQINNPIAGQDHLLLSLAGYGALNHQLFGFASCERAVQSAEGMNVLIHNSYGKKANYKISNIEYTDFTKEGIKDEPRMPGDSYSCFPANTNILFMKLKAVEAAAKKLPFPGLLINLKQTVGKSKQAIGRLESIMQNIADAIQSDSLEHLKTYLLYFKRNKTISAIKKTLKEGASLLETPEGAHLTLLQNGAELLNLCRVSVPSIPSEKNPTPFLFSYHPALGPVYSIIAQKIRGGKLHPGSELSLEIACLNWENVEVKGSLCIEAESPLGHRNKNGEILYSDQEGKCTLVNVNIDNAGVDYAMGLPLWKEGVARNESLKIHIAGNGEFYAENISFYGPHEIFVPSGYKMTCVQEGKTIHFKLEKIKKPTWRWSYHFDRGLTLTF